MSKRQHISFKTKLAAALCSLVRPDSDGRWVPIISHEDAKNMDEDQILSLFQWDHFPVAKALDGPDEHWNLRPLLIKEHRERTYKKDIPTIAKVKRLAKKHEEFRRRVLAKSDEQMEAHKRKRSIKSAGFAGWTKFDGTPVRASDRKGKTS